MAQAEGVGGAEDEPGHRLRGHERVTALGMTEPRQVDGHQAVSAASHDQTGTKASRLSGHGLSSRAS